MPPRSRSCTRPRSGCDVEPTCALRAAPPEPVGEAQVCDEAQALVDAAAEIARNQRCGFGRVARRGCARDRQAVAPPTRRLECRDVLDPHQTIADVARSRGDRLALDVTDEVMPTRGLERSGCEEG